MAGGADARQGADGHLTRKQFLTMASVGLGGVMGAMIGVPVAGMVLTPAVKGTKFPAALLGKVDDFPEGQWKKVVLQPSEGENDSYVRRRVAFVRRNADDYNDAFAPANQKKFSVLSNRCAHLGCPVTQQGEGFVCPCHGGAYDDKGKRTAGPPARSLDRFEWEERGDELWAVDEYSVTQAGKRVVLHDQGQRADGVEKYLYPVHP